MNCYGCRYEGNCGFPKALKKLALADFVDCPCSYCIVKVTCLGSCELAEMFDDNINAIGESLGATRALQTTFPKM